MKLFQTLELRVTDDEDLLNSTVVGEWKGTPYYAIDFISPSQLVEMLPYDKDFILPPTKAKNHVAVFKFPSALFVLPIMETDPAENVEYHSQKIFASRKHDTGRSAMIRRIRNLTFKMILEASYTINEDPRFSCYEKDINTGLTLVQFAEKAEISESWNSETTEVTRIK